MSTLSTVPDDVLLIVFETIIGPATLPWPTAEYSPERAIAPFTLAAVCQRWRSLAQATPTIWSYFGFPPELKLHTQHLRRLDILVSLAKNVTIDVLFECDGWRPDTAQLWNRLTLLMAQWRTAWITISDGFKNPFDPDLMPQILHRLKQLVLSCNFAHICLPNAPVMARLYLNCNSIDLQYSLPQLPSLRSLICLTAEQATTESLCRSYASQLVELCIVDDMVHGFSEPIHCLNLATLILDDALFIPQIHAPNLHELAIRAHTLRGLGDTGFANVVHLVLYGDVHEQAADRLQKLRSIVTISFAAPEPIESLCSWRSIHYTVTAGFFNQLATVHPPIFPALESIHFGVAGSIIPFQSLLDFIESRNQVTEEDGDHAETNWQRPSILKRVTMSPELEISMPQWASTRLSHLLQFEPAAQ
ncbi:hypothetical protein BKA62DRAFT_708140 [Auriculariales sp. MPI-PUGE-AT-0066]|nr:hypothetical protein BKA62DRAFT_708140 [Auriculariales sp. MPI-PUGE-AT-0066]